MKVKNRDDIIRMAREASEGMLSYDAEGEWRLSEQEVVRFAALVSAAEREECAKVAASINVSDASNYPFHIAAAIRARSET